MVLPVARHHLGVTSLAKHSGAYPPGRTYAARLGCTGLAAEVYLVARPALPDQ